ncbi:uncharacterized protein PV07_10904 [Cladophialophora immunda]|uniref:Uncharacterized protein n=1 Tax=Cladophialophora immunda TaxID=569365 RepID=A0A0D2CGH8_9EURO|nr:uncharacterized protein PV07_10904 [Cladophialophora immunda]KIW22624.1 hypothetical protein PV07_10904 [Cladophialophora immunda]
MQENTGMVHLLILNGSTIDAYLPTLPPGDKLSSSVFDHTVYGHSGLARYINLLREGKSPEEALEATWELPLLVENRYPTHPLEYNSMFMYDDEVRRNVGRVLFLRHIIEGLSYLDALHSSRMGERSSSVPAYPPFGHLTPAWIPKYSLWSLARTVNLMEQDTPDMANIEWQD